MNYGVIPENLLERAALWMGRVPVPMVDLLFGLIKARAIMAGVSLGIFDALRDQAKPPDGLARELGLDREALRLLLRTLAHVGYLSHDGEAFALTSLARRTMITGGAAALTGYARWNESQWQFLVQLESLVRTGVGLDFHHTLDDESAWAHYQRGMFEAARFDAATLARLVPVSRRPNQLLDLGGSHGLLGAAICRRHPPMRSLVIDLPQALDHGRALAREAGHADLVDHRAGDLRSHPLEDADVVLLSNILHHFTTSDVKALLSRIKLRLRPAGTVAIWDVEAPPSHARANHGDLAALYFLLTSTAGTYDGHQYADWLRDAGFTAVRVLHPRMAPGRVLVTARNRAE
jgi:trans-aconitate methyltransferase